MIVSQASSAVNFGASYTLIKHEIHVRIYLYRAVFGNLVLQLICKFLHHLFLFLHHTCRPLVGTRFFGPSK